MEEIAYFIQFLPFRTSLTICSYSSSISDDRMCLFQISSSYLSDSRISLFTFRSSQCSSIVSKINLLNSEPSFIIYLRIHHIFSSLEISDEIPLIHSWHPLQILQVGSFESQKSSVQSPDSNGNR